MASEKSKILVVGGTGHLGRHVVAASARQGHPTFAFVRETALSDPTKAELLKSFQDAGVTLVKGDLHDQASLLTAVKAADVVISTVGAPQIADQTRLIDAIKKAGNIKRFIPSEFGLDVDRSAAVEPTRSTFITTKAVIRRAVEAAGVPYTYVWTGYFFGYGLPGIGQVLAQSPPDDKVVILGDGDAEVSYVDEADIGTYTVLAADDPRAENRTLYVKPPANTLSHNELLALWEKKTSKAFERVHLAEDDVLKQIQELPVPLDRILLSIGHAVHIKGEHKFKIDPSSGVDAGELYPDVKYTPSMITSTGCSDRDPHRLPVGKTFSRSSNEMTFLKPKFITFSFANRIITETARKHGERRWVKGLRVTLSTIHLLIQISGNITR